MLMKINIIIIILFLLSINVFSQREGFHLIKWNNSYQDSLADVRYYFAWKISDIDSFLIVADGYEDGIDYSIYKISNTNSLKLLFRFNPILIDSSNKLKKYYWGYPWDINDIKTSKDKDTLKFMCSINHSIERDGVIDIPSWQKVLPAIFFIGKTTQPNISVGKIDDIKYLTIQQIIDKIK